MYLFIVSPLSLEARSPRYAGIVFLLFFLQGKYITPSLPNSLPQDVGKIRVPFIAFCWVQIYDIVRFGSPGHNPKCYHPVTIEDFQDSLNYQRSQFLGGGDMSRTHRGKGMATWELWVGLQARCDVEKLKKPWLFK